MGKTVIHNCDICGKKLEELEYFIKIPTKLIVGHKSLHCYEDVYQEVPYNIFGYTKELDICEECLLKIFNSLGVEKEGSILKTN